MFNRTPTQASVTNSDDPPYDTSLSARAGKAKAITATARKLVLLVYRVLSGSLVYNDPGATEYHQLNRARELRDPVSS